MNQSVVIETQYSSSGAFVTDNWTYLDDFDRPIVVKDRTMFGVYIRVDTQYDALGRLYRQSAPCLWASCTNYWTTNGYDLANRATSISRPISDANSTLQTTDIFYEGLTTRVRDALNRNSISIRNAAGQLARSSDHDGYYQAFDYDAFGNPKRITDQLGNTLQSSDYNLRGALTARADMDMGAWTFSPNPLGEVTSQTNANGQVSSFAYDRVGRMTSRNEPEGVSTWTYGTSGSNVGKLTAISGPGYSEAIGYNALALPNSRAIAIGSSTYTYNFGYNTFGKLANLTYPSSTSSYRLKLALEYQNGELYRIKDFNAPTTVFWEVTGVNTQGGIKQETLGNGLVSNRAFDAVTGWLKNIQTGASGGTGIQNLAYEWDLVGNLKKRKDLNQSSLTEEFFYDNLYRLDYSTLNGVTNLNMDYDALGNITAKSDVGNYTYHASKKHQVVSTSNGWSSATTIMAT